MAVAPLIMESDGWAVISPFALESQTPVGKIFKDALRFAFWKTEYDYIVEARL